MIVIDRSSIDLIVFDRPPLIEGRFLFREFYLKSVQSDSDFARLPRERERDFLSRDSAFLSRDLPLRERDLRPPRDLERDFLPPRDLDRDLRREGERDLPLRDRLLLDFLPPRLSSMILISRPLSSCPSSFLMTFSTSS